MTKIEYLNQIKNKLRLPKEVQNDVIEEISSHISDIKDDDLINEFGDPRTITENINKEKNVSFIRILQFKSTWILTLSFILLYISTLIVCSVIFEPKVYSVYHDLPGIHSIVISFINNMYRASYTDNFLIAIMLITILYGLYLRHKNIYLKQIFISILLMSVITLFSILAADLYTYIKVYSYISQSKNEMDFVTPFIFMPFKIYVDVTIIFIIIGIFTSLNYKRIYRFGFFFKNK